MISKFPLTVVLVILLVVPSFGCAREQHCSFQPGGNDALTVPEGFGVNINFTDPQPGELKMLAAGGFRWVRVDFKWDVTEAEPAKYDFAAYDRLLEALAPFGIKAQFILAYGNPNYDKGAPPRTPAAREAFARWAVAAAKHFSGRGILWEIYNEPNNDQFWPPRANVNEYIALVQEVGRAFKAALPNERLVGPAAGEMDFAFLEACFKAGLLEYWSAVTVHPYLRQDPELVAPEYCRLRALIKRYAPVSRSAGLQRAKDIPIISGEWGYSAVWPGVNEETQGQLFARQALTNLGNNIPLSIWYQWRDEGQDPKDPEHHFGVVTSESREGVLVAKPTYKAAQTLTTFLNGYRFERRLDVGGKEDYVLVFRKAEERRVAAWTTAESLHGVLIPAQAANYRLTSHVGGDAGVVRADQKGLLLNLSRAPVYFQLQYTEPRAQRSDPTFNQRIAVRPTEPRAQRPDATVCER